MSRWLRINEDCIDNPKILKLPEALRWQWVALLCVASKNDGVLPPIDDVALCLRVPEAKAAEFIAKLVKARLIDREGDVFVPHNWNKRQFKSDSSTDRVKRHREKQRNAACNVSGNVSPDVSETVTATPPEQSRAETESEQSRADACAPLDEDLRRRAAALGAGISAHFLGRNLPVPRNLDRCGHWLGQGYQQGKILTAVELVLKRGAKPAVLEYFDGAIADAHADVAGGQTVLAPVVQNVFVEVGTLEWGCWEREYQRLKRRPPMQRDTRIDSVVKTGWWFPTRVPEGYDECTGERIAPAGDEAAA